MSTEMDFNEEPKHGEVFCASGLIGCYTEKKVEKPDKWKIEYCLPDNLFGESISYTRIDADGKMWIGNGEYESQVNFCPVTGKKSRIKIDEPNIEKI